jgi:hypothetical protein
MFLGGWLYPDAVSAGFVGAEATFDGDAVDCAGKGREAVQATRTSTKRRFKACRSGMSKPPLQVTKLLSMTGWTVTGAKSYVGRRGKSMKVVGALLLRTIVGRKLAMR